MASDWIKMRTDIYRDPKVSIISDFLMNPEGPLASYVGQNCARDMAVTRNVMRNVTVGALVSLWGVIRLRGKRDGDDLVLKCASLSVIDDVTELPGFGDALCIVGWVEVTESGLVFPDFFSEYNVDPNEDTKTKNSERQRKHREKLKGETAQNRNVTRNVTVTSFSNAREEKRREENNTNHTHQQHSEVTQVCDIRFPENREPEPKPKNQPRPPNPEPPTPTPAGEVCKALKALGMPAVSPGHPELLAMIERGVSVAMFEDAATKAVAKGKGFAYMLAILAAQLASAKAIESGPSVAAEAWDASRKSIEAMGIRLGLGAWNADDISAGREHFPAYTERVRRAMTTQEVAA